MRTRPLRHCGWLRIIGWLVPKHVLLVASGQTCINQIDGSGEARIDSGSIANRRSVRPVTSMTSNPDLRLLYIASISLNRGEDLTADCKASGLTSKVTSVLISPRIKQDCLSPADRRSNLVRDQP